MRKLDVKDKVRELGVNLPPVEIFWRIGDLTALRQDSNGNFYRANYERGLLLYSLVAKYQPKVILEFGTGRGYGALCIAWALVENEEVEPIFDVELIWSDQRWYGSKYKHSPEPDYGMIWVDSKRVKMSWKEVFNTKNVKEFLAKCRKQLKRRQRLTSVKAVLKPVAKRLGIH